MKRLRFGFLSALAIAGVLGLATSACSDSKSDGDAGGSSGQPQGGEASGEAQGGDGTAPEPGAGGADAVGGSAAGGEPSGAAGAPDGPGPGDSAFDVIPLPEGAMIGVPLTFNDVGQVIVAGAVDGYSLDTLFVVDGSESSLVPTGDYTVSLNGLTIYTCINNEGQIGFNGQSQGIHQPAFFNGTDVVPVDFGASDGGLVLRTCNDAGTVIASTATGTETWSWTDGTPSPIIQEVFSVTPVGMNQAGNIAFNGSYYADGTFTAYPDGFLASAGPSESDVVAGVITTFQPATLTPATWKLGDDHATPLTGLPDVENIALVGISDHGVVLTAKIDSDDHFWVLADGELTELGAAGYELRNVADVNALGEILMGAKADDSALIAGLILRP